MAKIVFKAKPVKAIGEDKIVYIVCLPKTFTGLHCDMDAMRRHPKIGDFANSSLFPQILRREIKKEIPFWHIRTDEIPNNVTIEKGSLLWTITINI